MVTHLQPLPLSSPFSTATHSGISESTEDRECGGHVCHGRQGGLGRLQAGTGAHSAGVRGEGNPQTALGQRQGFPRAECDLRAQISGRFHRARASEFVTLHLLHLLSAGQVSQGGDAPVVRATGFGTRGSRAGRRLPGGCPVRLGICACLGRRSRYFRNAGCKQHMAISHRGSHGGLPHPDTAVARAFTRASCFSRGRLEACPAAARALPAPGAHPSRGLHLTLVVFDQSAGVHRFCGGRERRGLFGGRVRAAQRRGAVPAGHAALGRCTKLQGAPTPTLRALPGRYSFCSRD
ncbi:unnamed protein product [Symbiodinium pilosum]|uniref:Uncharacterized protein n=1 Tax=Symbiodinium pilosum TaxID=2952 RepID=A0A812VAX0_SYMPI|nr:unnamed protein product [Symbiodinium pilosum]